MPSVPGGSVHTCSRGIKKIAASENGGGKKGKKRIGTERRENRKPKERIDTKVTERGALLPTEGRVKFALSPESKLSLS